jgi:cytochrome c553
MTKRTRRRDEETGGVPAIHDSSMTKILIFTAAISSALATALASSWAAAQGASVGDAAKGAQKNQMCTGCHGIEGWRTAFPEVYSVPRIGGQHEAYIVKALQQYKSGERRHPSMRAIAAPLSEQDMADLAAYYAQGGVKTASK